MSRISVARAGGVTTGALLISCVTDHGSVSHPYFSSHGLRAGPDSARNLGDAVHFLCALHGRFPGVIDLAAARTLEAPARIWLSEAEPAVSVERHYLSQLAVAVGSVPSTPGGRSSEAAMVHQRNALSTLAQSDRRGCALGAALAFALDWNRIRSLLDRVAERVGMDPPPCQLGNDDELRLVAEAAGDSPALERALLFGAQQLALQHRGVWDLLEARQQARLDS